MKLSILIVNYKSQDYLKKCLDSIKKHLKEVPFAFEAILINNDKQSLNIPTQHYPFPIKFIENPQNQGFGMANNIGAQQAQGEILFFLNPDTTLVDDSLLSMLDYLTEHPQVGIIGPQIIQSPPNRPQPWTCGKQSTLLSILLKNTFLKPWNKRKITDVDWLSGTALMIRKADFMALNGFDEKFFMYFEDQDLCLRLKHFNKKVIFYPKAKIIHFDGKSWNNNKQKKGYFYKSQDHFFQKHRPKLETVLLKAIRFIAKGL